MQESVESICVKPYHWEHVPHPTKHNGTMIRAWCHDRESNPVCVYVEDYAIPLEIVLSNVGEGVGMKFNKNTVRNVYEALMNRIDKYETDEFKVLPYNSNHFLHKKPLYHVGLTSNSENGVKDLKDGLVSKDPILRIKVNNTNRETLGILRRALMYPLNVDLGSRRCQVKGVMYHQEFTPVDKILVELDIRQCNWISVPKIKPRNKITTLEQEYVVSTHSIEKVPLNDCSLWQTTPTIFSFDFECDTPNKRKFPDLWDARCPITMVSCGVMKEDGSNKKSWTIVVGDCPPTTREGFEVIIVKTEIDLLKKMCELISEHDPDVITGYNIQSFDFEYADARITARGRAWPECSRVKGVESSVDTTIWESQAYSSVKVSHFHCPGRIVIDVIQEAKRNNKFPSYKLDYVANHFLGGGKVPLSPYDMFCAFEKHRIGLAAGKGTPEYEVAMKEISNVVTYCEEDADLCLRLFKHMKIWVNAVETANVMRVNIYDLFTRGQQIRCLSQLFEAAWNSGYYMNKMPVSEIPFEGGKVQDPIPGLHDNVMVIDFASLYPSIIQAYNICYTTYIRECYRHLIPREMCNIKEVACTEAEDVEATEDDDISKGIRFIVDEEKKVREFWFIKEEYLPGLVPTLVKKLCQQRRAVRNLQKNETYGGDAWTILEKKQIAIKVSTNSFFGFMGVLKNGKRPFREGAVATTSWGRQLIGTVNSYLVDTYGTIIIYGDTDSSMIQMPNQVKTGADCEYWINRVCGEITNLFPEAIVMEPEYYGTILSIKKKKYVIRTYNKDGTLTGKSSVKGIMSVRREICPWAKETYDKMIDMIFSKECCFEVLAYMSDRIELMLEGGVPHGELLASKSVSAHYSEKSKNAEMKLFSENMKNNYGKVIEAGERLGFLVVKDENKKYKGERMMMEDIYLSSLETETPLEIDYVYYVEKMLMTHADDLLYICFKDQLIETEFGVSFRKTEKSHYCRHVSPVNLICNIVKNGGSVEDYREMIVEYEDCLRHTAAAG